MKVLIIYNPKSGLSNPQERDEIINYMIQHNIDYTMIDTRLDYSPVEILADSFNDSFDTIVTSGGDGTISKTIQGIHNEGIDVPLLILPNGTTNEIAQNLGLIDGDITTTLDRLFDRQFKNVDIGLIDNKDAFTYALTFGNFTEVTYNTPQELKNWLGYRAYILYGLLSFRRIHTYTLTFESDGLNETSEFVFGAISNSKSMGNIITYNEEDIGLDDGIFEVLFIKRPRNIRELRLILKSLTNHDYNNDMFMTFSSSELHINSKRKIAWNIDGEFGGDRKSLSITNVSKRITLVI